MHVYVYKPMSISHICMHAYYIALKCSEVKPLSRV